ncbi:hypothetical protein [Natrarchaeobaculum sulfurireducens]|nr:hypothetical protein [Natrarchaeobaculum sulfurireducens]
MTPPDVTDFDAETPTPGEIELSWSDVLDGDGRYHIRIREDTKEIID